MSEEEELSELEQQLALLKAESPEFKAFVVGELWDDFLLALERKSLVIVYRNQLNTLIAQNTEIKADVIALVNIFSVFAGLLNGKGNMAVQIVKLIPKMMADIGMMERMAAIVPIIEKYKKTPETLTDAKE